jgi:peptidoglycan/xylan/chitin deacetylase (PgdA/CDA1 family)
MTSRRDVLAVLAAGAVTLTACSSPAPTRASWAAPSNRPSPPPAPSTSPSPSLPPSHALTGGSGPDGSVTMTGSSSVALTFDDGPDPVNTPVLLDLLGEHGIKASFSLVGFRARDNPELVHRLAAEGHTLVNHSWQHLMDLGQRPPSYVEGDLGHTLRVIQTAAPDAPVRYFRAPGGNFTPSLVQVARDHGMSPLFWNVDPRDWDSANYGFGASMVNHIVSSVEQAVRPGMIVLSHDCKHPDTITAYRTLLPWLAARYTLTALPT